MIVNDEQVSSHMQVRVARYTDLSDLAKEVKAGKHAKKARGSGRDWYKWAGGSHDDFYRGCQRGDVKYAKRAEKYVDRFANLALKDYERTLDFNMQTGVLDYHAAMLGDPLCVYGPTIEETDRAPVQIYLDCWTSVMIPKEQMERRGIALLALVQALSVFRPVMLSVVTGTMHSPTRTNVIQIVPVPTAPMNLARASWMMASPMFFRVGLLDQAWNLAKSSASCGIPLLADSKWQQTQLGEWLAAKENVRDVVHLPFMMYSDNTWNNDASTLAWVKAQLARFVDQ